MSSVNGDNESNRNDENQPGTSREQYDDEDEDDQGPAIDNWDLWAKIHSNRDVRLKLLCRDPDDRTPAGSNSVVVRKIPLDATKEQIATIFHKAGAIKSIFFPKIAPHFTTKYCFITFFDCRQADRAQRFFDGYHWGRDRLQVVSYDACYKYRQSLLGPKAARDVNDDDQGTSIVFNAIRQAEAQSESRKTRFQKVAATQLAQLSSTQDCPAGLHSSVNDSLLSLLNCDADGSDNSDVDMADDTGNIAAFQQLPGASILSEEAKLDYYLYRECDTVDDVLLDSEIGFLSWLEGRLKFAGPLHYTDKMIGRALLKTPSMVQNMFTWFLGAFRCLSDGQRFRLVGPFMCLPSHDWCAEDKCIALGFKSDEWYKEEWEPLPPNQICSAKGLVLYLRSMLERFGPLRLDDIKLQQLALFLPPTAFSQWSESEETNVEDSPNNTMTRKQLLLDGLRGCSEFCIEEGIVYSTKTHYEILLLKSTMEEMTHSEAACVGQA